MANIDWTTLYEAWYTPATEIDMGKGRVNIEQKANGKIHICGMKLDGSIWEGEVDNINVLTEGSDVVQNWVHTGITIYQEGLDRKGRCQTFWADGEFWMSTFDAGSSTHNAEVNLYKSASGNGGDWVYFSSVYSKASNDDPDWGNVGIDVPGSILVLPNGRYVIGTQYIDVIGRLNYPTIWTSENKGATWMRRFTGADGVGMHAYFDDSSTRILRLPSGNLLWAFYGSYPPMAPRFVISTNDAIDWSQRADDSNIGDVGDIGSLFMDDTNVYFLATGFWADTFHVWKLTAPDSSNAAELITTAAAGMAKTKTPTHADIVGGKLILIASNKVLLGDLARGKGGAAYWMKATETGMEKKRIRGVYVRTS